ncbi:peroxidase-related enzyme [Comamonas aquatica]|uniref:CMD domain-containing protein n=1 Tax=Comamonas aquatica TaxID=225991 RepID=UPI0022DE37C0|nr:peroxidase-related enzyme [Comamonas aquatica]MDH1902477.1 peroxidase-related enzyme [Comamonas aquatica]WBM42359.1 peroxidase-related enzyme [Comamonas aquatica]
MTDTIDRLAGLAAGNPVFATRHERSKVAVATQACEDLLLGAALTACLSQIERLVLAAEQARVSGVDALAAEYRARALALGDALTPALRSVLDQAGTQTGDARLDAMLHFVRTLALKPAHSDQATLLAIPAAGLSVDDTVLLAQLVGFVAYQARLLVGVQAMAALGGIAPSATPDTVVAAPFVHPANLPAPGEPLRRNGFTSETLDWKSWLPVLDPATATPEQQKVLEISHPKAKTMDFYLLLGRQPAVLLERSQAFNAIMYAPGGLSRAEREVAATAVSRSNGCVYCASVHAQRFEQLAKRNDVMAQLFDDPDTAGTNARERAIIQASLVLTRAPGAFAARDVLALREAGLSDLEILDMLHSAALFGWANRLMLNLGVEIWPQAA